MSKADRTRQFIIEQSAPLINRKGMSGTSMSDIMDATKMAKGGIYGHFESKEEICNEALGFLLNQAGAAIDLRLAQKDSAPEKIAALLDYYLDVQHKEDYYGCPMLNFGTEADDTNPAIRERVSRAISQMESRIAKILRTGISNGELRKDFDAESFALKTLVMIEGALWMSRVQNNQKKLRQVIGMLKKEIEAAAA